MNLVIDIGNTCTKTALFSNEEKGFNPYLPVMSHPAGGEEPFLRDLLSQHPDIRHCILSSVRNHSPVIEDILREKTRLLIMNSRLGNPLINRYQTPETLGNDRLASATGGHALFPDKDVLVINAGTCIIYDFVTAAGEYPGGSISPGMQMRFKALHTFTGKLPLISPGDGEQITGDTTETSILSGVMQGITAEMEGVAAKYQEMYPGLQVVLSGGDLNYFVKRLKINIFAFPNIVIHGLHQILKFNVDHTH